MIGQINHQYADILLRDATQLELNNWLKSTQTQTLTDEAVALNLLASSEFRSKQLAAPQL